MPALTVAFGTVVTPSCRNTVPASAPDAARCKSRCTVCPWLEMAPDVAAARLVTGSTAMSWNEPTGTWSKTKVPSRFALRVIAAVTPKRLLSLWNVRFAFGTG